MPSDFTELEIDVALPELGDEAALRQKVALELGVPVAELPELCVLQRSLDARKGRVRFHLTVGPKAGEPRPLGLPEPREVDVRQRVLVVGDGPAGLFCAYELARAGIGSVVIDRGKPVQPRRHDLKAIVRHGQVDPDSNYCFGEGGAGTYSDGKLYTRSHKRGDVRDVIELLALHGAPHDVLVDARPHIGSNKLPKVVSALRERLEGVGVRFLFGRKLVGILRSPSGQLTGARLADGSELGAEALVLATGHSARDVLELLLELGVTLQPKGFAAGVRIEHPQPLIDSIQYGSLAGHARLPSAAYKLAHTEDGRGVFSFCMCPGGFMVPAATEPEGLVLNGMSLSRRSSRFANSGLVVAIEPEDLARAGLRGVLAGVELQRKLEQAALQAGGGGQRAPATRVTDFLHKRASTTVPRSSYGPGLAASDVADVLDGCGLPLSDRLRRALPRFEHRMRGYVTREAVLCAVESRTSSPVRVLRDPASLQSADLPGLYPTGEGAGYAGGIVSAALDGIRVARAIASQLGS